MGLLQQALDAFIADPVIALGNILATSYLIPLVSFVVSYFRKSPWWTTDLGVALMAQKVAFIAIFVLLDIGYFWHEWVGRAAARLVLFGIVAVSLWLDQVNLRRYQKRYPHDRHLAPRPSLWHILQGQFRDDAK